MSSTQDLGLVTAYGYAVEGGYTGTEAEFKTLLGQQQTYHDEAVQAAEDAEAYAAQAMSGTPDGYASLVSTVNSLNSALANTFSVTRQNIPGNGSVSVTLEAATTYLLVFSTGINNAGYLSLIQTTSSGASENVLLNVSPSRIAVSFDGLSMTLTNSIAYTYAFSLIKVCYRA